MRSNRLRAYRARGLVLGVMMSGSQAPPPAGEASEERSSLGFFGGFGFFAGFVDFVTAPPAAAPAGFAAAGFFRRFRFFG